MGLRLLTCGRYLLYGSMNRMAGHPTWFLLEGVTEVTIMVLGPFFRVCNIN